MAAFLCSNSEMSEEPFLKVIIIVKKNNTLKEHISLESERALPC